MPFYKGHKINVGRPCSKITREKISLAVSKQKIVKNCLFCKKTFEVWPSHNFLQCCSKKCSDETRKGKPSWNKGLKGFRAGEKRPGIIPQGEENKCWKGDKAGYGAKHMWVRKMFGQAKNYSCMFCGFKGEKGRRIEWANISGKYRREPKEWTTLCKKCHAAFDSMKCRKANH
jgi:hypothetical protein